ncbi:MAG TPA: HEAT repeat domain-containing protein [Planctomycetota bacterium]
MHLATRFSCLLLALSCAAAAHAQQEPRPTDADLLRDLGTEERGFEAVCAFVRRGAPAVATLTAAIRDPVFQSNERQLALAIYALGKIGDAAAPAALLLIDLLPAAKDDVLRNVYWALGEIGPKAQAMGKDVLGPLRERKPTPGWSHQEWSFACRRIDLGLDLSEAEASRLLKQEDHATLVAVAGLLCRAEPGARVPREQLLETWQRMEPQWRQHGEGSRRVMLELARAVAKHAPDTPEGTAARAILIHHFDLDVRLQTVMQMGQDPGADPAASVQALQRSLTDGSILVRREAVTALAMIGPPAAAALPALQELAKDRDAQIRARAAAAVRAIGPKGK